MNPRMEAHALLSFDNLAIAVTDIERSAEWYCRVLGFERGYETFLGQTDAHFLIIERGDLKIELISRSGTVRHPDAEIVPGPHLDKSGAKGVVFRVADLAALERVTAALEAEEVNLLWRLQKLSEDGLMATMIRDPDGTIINILCYP